ncbi:MAG: alkaline phosphatase family protein [Erysipelotrichaceae bacterium]|nr:alkaline phosphatase family protein [Erysipelotrichaceae bacterium]
MTRNKLFVFCLDALCTSDLDLMKEMSNFAWIFEKGSVVKHVEPIYPSFTYPCHCTIITGNTVKHHGVPHNAILKVEDANPPWYNQRADVKCPTIFDYAKKAGYLTCSLSWPVSGKADIDLNMPMIVPAGYMGDDPGQFLWGNASEELMEKYFWKYGRYLMGKDRSLDLYTMALAPDIIRDYGQPDVMFVKMCDLDSARHGNGVYSEEAVEQLRKHNYEFGVLLESIRRYGDFEHTNFVILGDHGQQDITMDLNVNILLRDAGFIRCDEQGKLVDYDAYCHSVSMSAWIQLKDPNDKVMREKVYDFLKSLKDDPKYNIGYLYTKEEADELFGLTGPLDFVIEGKEPMAFSSTLEGRDAFEKYLKPGQHRSVASHGHLPWRDETTTFIAVGPNVAENVVIERSSMLNEAPTMAAMLGLQMENIDGHVLEELIRQ